MSRTAAGEPAAIHCAAATGDRCGEGAVWHAEENALYWVDINRFLIHRFQATDESVKSWHFTEPPTALALTEDPSLILAVFGSHVCLWVPGTNRIVKEIFRLDLWPEIRFNDARVDPRGSLWAGTMRNNVAADGSLREVTGSEGVLYRIEANGEHRVWKSKIGISNTVAWSPDGKKFYFGDTLANAIYVWDYDGDRGEIANEKVLLKDYDGVPDGSAMDAEGCLWNCRPRAGSLIRISPAGEVVKVIPLPVRSPTTCAFGGSDLATLYITSAASPERLGGCLFSIAPGVKGIPENRFKL